MPGYLPRYRTRAAHLSLVGSRAAAVCSVPAALAITYGDTPVRAGGVLILVAMSGLMWSIGWYPETD